ncbi:MAG: hypothetical protein HOO88_05485 [Kiritimatiellaceae bacterium]|nr:hypothetical protein [Kiritimatiellaceae bacterium]
MINTQKRHAKNILRRNSLICYVPIHQRMERLNYSRLRAIRATCYGFILPTALVLLALPSGAQQPDARQLAYDITAFNRIPPNPAPHVCEPPVQWPGVGLWTLTDGAREELETIAFCLWNEAHEDGRPAIEAVASVIHNRARYETSRYVDIIARSGQFSGYRATVPDDFIHPNVQALSYSGELQAWTDCHLYAERMIRGGFQPANNSDHFYSGPPPAWSKNLTNVHTKGRLTFGRMQK